MKRLTVFVLMLVLLVSMGTVVVSAAETLKVWLPPFGTGDALDKEFWETAFIPFEEQHNCDVLIEIIPWSNYEDKYLMGFAGGTGPDVGYMSMEMVSSFIQMGNITKMDEYITAEDRSNYLYLDKGVIDGGQYMFPFIVGNPRVLMCNMDILHAAGVESVPRTWDELLSASLKIMESDLDVYPFMQPWGDSGNMVTMFYPFFYQAGGRLVNESDEIVVNTPEMLKTVQFLYDLRHKYGILDEVATSLKGGDVKNLFIDGKVAMIVEATNFASQIAKAGIDWEHSLMTESRQGTFIAVDSLVLCTTAKNKELAYAAIQFMTSGEVMASYHNQVSMFAPIGRDEEYADRPEFEYIYTDSTIDLVPFPAIEGMYKVDDALLRNLQLMQLGQLLPEQVVEETELYVSFELDY
jgi:multiple sugar transport system substrate-binding protein